MAIIPIFIYRDRKSDKEFQEEYKRDAKWRMMVEEEERKKRAEKRLHKALERLKKEEEMAEASRRYEIERSKDPWQFSFLPEGWSIFGTSIRVIDDI